jgi:CheY-like chemotaxis protein
LVVLDLTMEGLGGFDVLATLREQEATKQLPVIIHTSKSLEDEDYSRLRSAIDVIPKSVMGTRDLAVSRFSQAFQKAGLKYVARAGNQPVVSE